jgi:uncharacterized protein
MTRSIIIFTFFLFLYSNVIGQNLKSSVLERKFDLNLLLIKEKLVADSIVSIYGNSLTADTDKKINDTALIKSLIQPNSTRFDNLICSTYKIPFIIKPLGWTSDYGHIFTKGQISELDSIITKFENQTENEIAIVTIDSSWTTNEKFDSLILSIANFWGVGKKNINNGIVIGISTGLRKIRINNGYGIEAKLTDDETKKIIDDVIVPEFKQGNYFEGTKKGLFALMQKVR